MVSDIILYLQVKLKQSEYTVGQQLKYIVLNDLILEGYYVFRASKRCFQTRNVTTNRYQLQ